MVQNTIAENAPATLRASRERSMCKRSVCKCLAIVSLHVRRINGAIKGWFLALEAGPPARSAVHKPVGGRGFEPGLSGPFISMAYRPSRASKMNATKTAPR